MLRDPPKRHCDRVVGRRVQGLVLIPTAGELVRTQHPRRARRRLRDDESVSLARDFAQRALHQSLALSWDLALRNAVDVVVVGGLVDRGELRMGVDLQRDQNAGREHADEQRSQGSRCSRHQLPPPQCDLGTLPADGRHATEPTTRSRSHRSARATQSVMTSQAPRCATPPRTSDGEFLPPVATKLRQSPLGS
jgi:hypothetical protein